MIYYSLSTLIRLGHKKIIIITTPDQQTSYENLLGNGSDFGIELIYAVQPKPEGIAQALLIAEPYVNTNRLTLILGDNIFLSKFEKIDMDFSGAQIVTTPVVNPYAYAVIEYDSQNKLIITEESEWNLFNEGWQAVDYQSN